MDEIITTRPENTEEQSKINIRRIDDFHVSPASLNNKQEQAGTPATVRTTQANECNHSNQESNSHSTNDSSSLQNVDNEAISPNCPADGSVLQKVDIKAVSPNCSADSSQPQETILAEDHKETENIAHLLQAIGDKLDASASDSLSEEIVEALRSIGDSIDAKIGPHSQNLMKMALGLSRINVGRVVFEVLRPSNFVGSLLCTSLQLILHYNSI